MKLFTTLLFITFSVFLFGQPSSLFMPGPVNFIETGDLDVPGDQITVEALIQYTGASTNIVSKHTNPGDVNYLLRIGSFEIATTNGFANFGGVAAAGVNLVMGETYHLAATYNGQFLRYYVNGCLTGEMAWTGDMVQNDLITAIGGQSACQCEQFTGYIDEVRIWNVARTQQEIADNMLDLPNPTTTPGLLAYYKFDNNFDNVQGNAVYDGTPVNAPQFQHIPAPLPDELNLTAYSSAPVCNGGSDAVIESFANGAYTPYEYSLDGTNYGASGTFSSLSAGTYDVYVRPQNNPDCIVTEQIIISEPTVITDNLTTTNVLCNGGNDGEATVAPAGGHGPDYVIDWNATGNGGNTNSNLSAGNHMVEVTDTCASAGNELIENGHFQSYYQGFNTDYSIGSPGPNIGGENIAVTYDANLYHSGFVGSGNQGSGNFLVVNGSISANQNVWCQTVNVNSNTNYNFSLWLSSLFTTSPGEIQVLMDGIPLGGVLTAPANTGVWEEHNMFWNSGNTTQVQICIEGVNLDDVGNDFGIDDVSLKPCESCTESFSFNISEPPALQLNSNTTDESCNGSQDGEIAMTVTGGTGTYEYSIDTANTFQNNAVFTGLAGGNYAIIVRDQNNCMDTLEVTVNTLPSVQFDLNISEVDCYGGSSGMIEFINVQNGAAPYDYSIDNGTNVQLNNVFNNLSSDNYTAFIEDDNGCSSSQQVFVNEPNPIEFSVDVTAISCFAADDGELNVNSTTGGTPGFQYSIDGTNYQGNALFDNLSAGNYTLFVQDQNGCTRDSSFTIIAPQPLSSTLIPAAVSCFGGSDGRIDFDNTTGGTPDYAFSINGGSNYFSDSIFNGLTAGFYEVEVVDEQGCQFLDTIQVTQPPVIQLDVDVYDVLCYGECNGSVSGVATGGTAPYTYLWSGMDIDQVGNQVDSLCAGEYLFTVVDDNGCTAQQENVVDQPVRVQAQFTTTETEWTILDPTVDFFNQSQQASSYEWYFEDSINSNEVNPVHTFPETAEKYVITLIASNANGCSDTVRRELTIENENLLYIPNTFTPDGNDYNETFKVEFFTGYEPTDYRFLVFNRWGEVVFEARSPNDVWDGTYQGKKAKDGTYIWKLEFRETITDERYIDTGHVTIIR